MATAPPPRPLPGSLAEKTDARLFLRLRVKDRTLDLIPHLQMTEQFVIRNATGLPFEQFLPGPNSAGEDSVFVMWWVARRQNGQPNLSFNQALKEWEEAWPDGVNPEDLELSEIDLDTEDPAEDTPEGSGPAS